MPIICFIATVQEHKFCKILNTQCSAMDKQSLAWLKKCNTFFVCRYVFINTIFRFFPISTPVAIHRYLPVYLYIPLVLVYLNINTENVLYFLNINMSGNWKSDELS